MIIETNFKRLYRPLCVYAMHYLKGDVFEAEDVVQDCFVKLWEVNPDNVRAFLYTAVRNECIDRLRKSHPEIISFSPYDLDGIISDEEARDRSVLEAQLWERIEGLPERCREIFLMSKRNGMTYSEIAEELGISVKSVEHQISRALKRIRVLHNYNQLLFVLSIA